MTREIPRKGSLTNAERHRILADLDEILARTSRVRDHLDVAARRGGLSPSSWSTSQMDALVRAAHELVAVTEETPVNDT